MPFWKSLICATLVLASTAAQALDLPTADEILQTARIAGISTAKTLGENSPADASSWMIDQIVLQKDAERPAPDAITIHALIKSGADLYLKSQIVDGHTLVYPTHQKASMATLPGVMTFKRVGLFTRSWEISFTWTGTLPPGLPLTAFDKPVSAQSPEGLELSKVIAANLDRDMKARQDASQATANEQAAQRQAMADRASKEEADRKSEILAFAKKFTGVWLPYTLSYPPDDKIKPDSIFRAVRIDTFDQKSNLILTLLKGSDEFSPEVQTSAVLEGGALKFTDDNCAVSVMPSKNQKGQLHLVFGNRTCADQTLFATIIPIERTPKMVREFVEVRKKSLERPAQSKSDARTPPPSAPFRLP